MTNYQRILWHKFGTEITMSAMSLGLTQMRVTILFMKEWGYFEARGFVTRRVAGFN